MKSDASRAARLGGLGEQLALEVEDLGDAVLGEPEQIVELGT